MGERFYFIRGIKDIDMVRKYFIIDVRYNSFYSIRMFVC